MAVVVAAALGVVTAGAGTAQAVGLPIGAVVRLDSTAPQTGEVISGLRSVQGYAEATEGITRVDFYVVEHSVTGDLGAAVPVASVKPSMPLGRASFDFAWDSTKTPQGLVDVVVVATSTTTSTAEARVLSLQVRNAVERAPGTVSPAPPAKTKPKARASATAATPATRPVAAPARAATRRAPVAPRALRVAGPVVSAAQQAQATAFYAKVGDVPVDDDAPVLQRAAAATVDAGRGVTPPIAIGLVLILAAAHVQRAVRVQLAPR